MYLNLDIKIDSDMLQIYLILAHQYLNSIQINFRSIQIGFGSYGS